MIFIFRFLLTKTGSCVRSISGISLRMIVFSYSANGSLLIFYDKKNEINIFLFKKKVTLYESYIIGRSFI